MTRKELSQLYPKRVIAAQETREGTDDDKM